MKQPHPLLQSDISNYTASDIVNIAAYYLEIPTFALMKRGRKKDHVLARMYIFDLLYSNKRLDMTFQKIGNMFGMHHTSVMHSMQTLKDYINIYDDVRDKLEYLHLVIYNDLQYLRYPKKTNGKYDLIENKSKHVTFRICETDFEDLVTLSEKKKERFSEFIRKCVLVGMKQN
jgi:hypothetical protein